MNRLVVIVAKGHVTADEIAANTKALVEADVVTLIGASNVISAAYH